MELCARCKKELRAVAEPIVVKVPDEKPTYRKMAWSKYHKKKIIKTS